MTLSAQRLGTDDAVAAGATETLYTVPAGRRAILRDVRIDSPTNATGEARIMVQASGNANAVEVLALTGVAARARTGLTDAFIVMDAGDKIIASGLTTGILDVWLSGHEFVI